MATMKKKVCGRWVSHPFHRPGRLGAGPHDRECTTARTKASCRLYPRDGLEGDPAKGWHVHCHKSKWDTRAAEFRHVQGSNHKLEVDSLQEAKDSADKYLAKA